MKTSTMRLVAVFLPLCAAAASFRVLEQPKSKCKIKEPNDLEGRCPISLGYSEIRDPDKKYSECITVRVRLKAGDLLLSPKIEVLPKHEIYRPVQKKGSRSKNPSEKQVKCKGSVSQSYLVTIEYFKVEAARTFSVSYGTSSSNCSVSHRVADPQPEFSFFVNKQSKSVSVAVDSDDVVYVRLCYQNNAGHCAGSSPLTVNKSAVLSIPHMLACVCVEVYYSFTDARRNKKCLFPKGSLIDVGDVWQTAKVELYKSYITWSYECPADHLNVSASLCWKLHEHLCIPVLDSSLQEEEKGHDLKFDISTVDKHPQVCVQFSLEGSLSISCLFQDDKSPWQTSTEAGRRSVEVHLKSTTPAKFSAQLCVLTERGCASRGSVHSVTVTEDAGDETIRVPIHDITERPCVQVWQSEPALKGRRILCMDYTHKRWGLYPAAVLTFALLGCLIYRVTKSGAAGLFIHKPLLLVGSSDRSAHVSAVCALASILQGELGATVRTSLWAENSQKQAGNVAGVADLGPLPWLYGQWEAICKVQGKILIVWSTEAKRTYERRKAESASVEKDESKKKDSEKANVKHERIREAVLEDFLKFNEKKLGKGKKDKSAKGKAHTELFDDKAWCSRKEPSTVIEPVFLAALGALEGELQGGKGKEVAIVYFQGFCHRRDIPKAFRGVQSYCLPQDFSKLIQELAEVRGVTKIGEFRRRCWYRLLSKVKSKWLARQLTQKLQAVLPQTQTVASSIKMTSD